jgi:acetyl esterase/lipase
MEVDVAIIMEAVKVLDKRSDFSMPEIRFLQDLAAKGLSKREAKVEKVNCNGVNGEFITSNSLIGEPKSTVFYLHGGGYCVGSCKSYRKPVANLSQKMQSRFLLLEYGLSGGNEEHRYPFALEQVFQAYKWLLGQGVKPSKLVLAGDSAGGGLAICLLLLLRERNVPLPSCVVCMSPWTDLSEESCIQDPELWNCPDIPFRSNNLAVRFARAYLGEGCAKQPTISPYYADLSGFPPLLLTVGGSEGLLHDIEKFYHKCRAQGVKVEYDVVKNMPHIFQILHQGLHPEIEQSLDRMKRFIWESVNS